MITASQKRNPESWLLRKKRAQLLLSMNATEVALSDIQQALRMCPSDGESHYIHALVMVQMLRPVAALESIANAKTRGWSDGFLLRRESEIQRMVMERRAVHSELKTRDRQSVTGRYYWNKVQVELELGLLEEADATAREWVSAFPDDPLCRWGKSHVACARGDYSSAKTELDGLVDPVFRSKCDGLLATFAALLGMWDEAETRARSALAVDPGDPDSQRILQVVWLARGADA